MRRRLLRTILVITVAAVAGFGVPLALSVRARNVDTALLTLAEEASRAAAAVPGSFESEQDPPELPTPGADVDTALYDSAGRRLLGRGPQSDATVSSALAAKSTQRNRNDLVVVYPISFEERVVGAVRASTPRSVVDARTHRTWGAMSVLAAVVLIAAAAVSALRSRSLARPLADLRADADTLGRGGEVPPRPPTGMVEIDVVQDALVDAATRLNASMANERALSADLAHQLSTPLASLRLRLETAQLQGDDESSLVSGALRDVERLEQTMSDILTLSRDSVTQRDPQNLSAILADVAAEWMPRLRAADRTITLDVAPKLPWVSASAEAVRQILDVLISNATVHGAGTVRLSAEPVGTGVIVAVSDEGTAVLDDHAIFERRSDVATGMGIGLSLAQRLAQAEDLRLLLVNRGPSPTFHLAFPGR